MKNEKKNIDQLIGEKLKDYEHIPPTDIWDGITHGLSTKSRKPLLMPLWKIAAGVAILLSIGLSYLMINRSDNLSEKINIVENNYREPSFSESKISENNTEETSIDKQSPKLLPDKRKLETTTSDRSKSIDKNEHVKSTEYIAENNNESNPAESDLVIIYAELSAEDFSYQKELIQPDDKINIPVNTNIIANWDMLHENIVDENIQDTEEFSFTASMSPLYSFRDIVGSSPENFNNAEIGKISYSGGLQFGIRQGKRLSFQTGLFYSKIGIGVNHIYSYNKVKDYSAVSSFNNTYIASNSIGQIDASQQKEIVFSANKAENDILSTSAGFQTEAATNTDAQLDQYFHVLEIPLIGSYTIIDKTINVNVLGGLSTNFIIGNEVFIEENGSESYFGKTSNINTVNYSGNLGLGFDYEMDKNFLLSLEPIFKYYLNSINSGNLINTRPYNFGFYTGIRYIF